jgi:hypothetical protein
MHDNSVSARRPTLGDRVRFRGAYVRASGVIIEELTEGHVRVQWDEVATPSIHRRADLQVEVPAAAG